LQHAGVKRFFFVRVEFDEAAFYFAVYCLTNKPAFLGRTIVVLADACAASVGGDDRVPERTFGEPVKMAAEDGLEGQSIAALKEIVGVEGAGPDGVAQRKMSEQDGRTPEIQFGQVLIEPGKSGRGYSGLLRLCSFAGIQADDLPAAVRKGVVDLFRKNPLIRRPVGG